MAEVHLVGQLKSGHSFGVQQLFCRWSLQIGTCWKLVEGRHEGQTSVASSEFDDICRWSYPIDLHLATSSIQGWPKIYVQIYHLDWLGRSHIYGYGFITVPSIPGHYKIDCYTWRPLGSLRDRFVRFFLGGGPQIKYPDLIGRPNHKHQLYTQAMGIVSFEFDLVLRHFTNYGITYN